MESNNKSETAGKVLRCKAAISRIPGEPLVIEDIEVDPPQAWEIRIKIICTSLCHTDITFWKMEAGPAAIFPRIFGHEAVGVVESVGEHVEEFTAGDTVLPVFLPNCNECSDCESQKSNMCSIFENNFSPEMPRDGTSRFKDMNVKITPEIPVDKACLLGCGVSTGIGAAWKVAEVEEGSTVAIFGLGPVGLAVAEGARQRGALKIIAVDLNPEKFDIGKKFGVTDFVNPETCGEKSVSEVIKELTNGGADYCFECIGLASLMQEAFLSSRKGWGKTVILGVETHGAQVSLNPYEFLRGRSVIGSLFGGVKPKSDIPVFAKKYLDNELRLDEFISHELGFQDINKAFELHQEGKSLRCIIWMDR
ncbi:alcohol dehydrogenase-like 1 isoform X2 [Quercus suber]|uniref:alcohol dehydrogenase-like 1 isoform X2 n=1 Tax=Quercus suber TaxID=58331 RepID=UPI0032E0376D